MFNWWTGCFHGRCTIILFPSVSLAFLGSPSQFRSFCMLVFLRVSFSLLFLTPDRMFKQCILWPWLEVLTFSCALTLESYLPTRYFIWISIDTLTGSPPNLMSSSPLFSFQSYSPDHGCWHNGQCHSPRGLAVTLDYYLFLSSMSLRRLLLLFLLLPPHPGKSTYLDFKFVLSSPLPVLHFLFVVRISWLEDGFLIGLQTCYCQSLVYSAIKCDFFSVIKL